MDVFRPQEPGDLAQVSLHACLCNQQLVEALAPAVGNIERGDPQLPGWSGDNGLIDLMHDQRVLWSGIAGGVAAAGKHHQQQRTEKRFMHGLVASHRAPQTTCVVPGALYRKGHTAVPAQAVIAIAGCRHRVW